MPDPPTIQRLRGLVLSASDLHSMNPEWEEAMVEDYLNILDNIITLAELIDIEIDQKIEEIDTDFTDGSIPFADNNLLIEDNTNLFWDNGNKLLNALDLTIKNLTASRYTMTDVNKKLVSSIFNDDELEFFIQAVA